MRPSYIPSSVCPSIQVSSLKASTILRCPSLFSLSTSEIILFIYASNLCVRLCVWPSIYPSIQTPSLKALAMLRCTNLFSLSTSSNSVRMDDDIIVFIYASKICTLVCLANQPASQILSLKPLTILWCTSLFCLSSSSILIGIEIILFIYASTLYRSLLLKLWLCSGVQVCSLCPLLAS